MPSATTNSAPGFAFQAFLRQAKPSTLRELIGASVIEVLQGLDPHLLSGDRFGDFAASLIDPSETLRDVEKRNHIIRSLPLTKARELAEKLGVKDRYGRDLYDNLCQTTSNNLALPALFSFFGVVRDAHAPIDTAASESSAQANYGLFDHQRAAASKTLSMLIEHPRKVVLHMPTGSGKTRTAMHIVASHLKQSEPTLVLWLAQNAELLDQAADEFEKAWGFLGNRSVQIFRFWGKRNPNLITARDGLIVAGLAKMSALDQRNPELLLRLADRVSLIIIDEAHQAIAPTYEAILTAFYAKRPRNALLGLTATPGRTWSNIAEDQRLSDYFERCKVTLEVEGYGDPVSFLIDQGYLARPIFRTLDSDAGLELSKKDIQEFSVSIDVPDTLLERLGADTIRNLKIITAVEELMKRHRRIIVFAPSVENARMLAAILTSRNHEANLVISQTDILEREKIIRRFRSNVDHGMVIINYGVLTTGFDAPATSAAIIARPTKSLVLYSQMVGRATRGPRAGGNTEAEIITVADKHLPGFGSIAEAFKNWEDVWHEQH